MKNIRPANPTRCFVDGNHEREFTYDPGFGARPFYVQVRGRHYMAASLILFAQDLEHIQVIISNIRMHIEQCNKDYHKNKPDSEFLEQHNARVKKWRAIEAAVHQQPNSRDFSCEIRPFDGTHPLKVAWAGNDYI